MRRTFLYVLAVFLAPFYPLLKRMRKVGDKVHFGEKVVVVTMRQGRRKILTT